MSIVRTVAITAAISLPIFSAVSPVKAEQTLRFNIWLPPTHFVKLGLESWLDDVVAATEGRVKYQTLKASLAPPPRQMDLVRDGGADVAFSSHAFNNSRFRVVRIAELPFSGQTARGLSIAHWRTHEKFLHAADEHRGVKLLALFNHPPGKLWNNKRALKSVDDVKGLKLTLGGGMQADIGRKLGVVLVQKPITQNYELISRGVVDGHMLASNGVYNFKTYKFIKYATIVPGGLYNGTFYFVMNQDTWDGFSKKDQNAVMKISGERLSGKIGGLFDEQEKIALDFMRDKTDIQFTIADPPFVRELKTLLEPFTQEFIDRAQKAGIDGKAALAYFQKQIEDIEGK